MGFFNRVSPKVMLLGLAVASAVCLGAATESQAHQPQQVMTEESQSDRQGDAKNIRGSFVLENVTKSPQTLRLLIPRSDSYSFKVSQQKLNLQPGEKVEVEYGGGIFQDGKWQVNFEVELLGEEGQLAGRHTVDVYYRVEGGKFELSNYEKLFLAADERDPQLGDSFKVLKDDGSIRPAPESHIKRPSMEELMSLEKLDREAIFQIPTESQGGEGSDDPRKPDIRLERPELQVRPEPQIRPELRTRPEWRLPGQLNFVQSGAELTKSFAKEPILLAQASTTQASGRFSWKGLDNLSHRAFGWRVRAWQKRNGSWKIMDEDWIQADGRWQLSFPRRSGEVKFQYIAYNRFFKPQKSNGDTYRWVGPSRSSISANHNEGSWIADTSTGAARGLGEIYDEGMDLWSKLYWTGGINPLRDKAIDVIFPNTSYDCGDGSGVPWSCASTSGKIWMIPSHAGRNGVMQHELAHQINYEYWNNQRPPGAGGSHNLTDCFTPGLALLEGFANFMVFWTQADRGTAPSSGFDFAIENPSFACDDPLNRNESWVASAFWDLHDTRADGQDNLWFTHQGAVPGMYLRSGMKNSMADFHSTYRNAANSNHRTIIDRIFRQNKIIN